MKKRQLDLTEHRIWKDKNIKPECKRIFNYLYSQGYDKYEFLINIGEIQPIIKIKNIGFRKNLQILEKFKYLIYREVYHGTYEITIC